MAIELEAARPNLMRAMNEQLLLGFIRQTGEVSRAELAQLSGLSKPTVALGLTNLEQSGLVRRSGTRTGLPGPTTRLYEVNSDIGYVLALDVGQRFNRGAISDMSGNVRIRLSEKSSPESGAELVAALISLSQHLLDGLDISLGDVLQTVLGSPGVYDSSRDMLSLGGALPDWDNPRVLSGLRTHFGPTLLVENNVNAAAEAERKKGHGDGLESFAFISVGTGIGMGLVLNGKLHRGAHGAAGEIGYFPIVSDEQLDVKDARKRGHLDAAASASGIVRAAKSRGMKGSLTAQHVFAAAAAGDPFGIAVVAQEARLVAKAICTIVAVADPDAIVLGGGIGRAAGFAEMVSAIVPEYSPIVPDIRVSAAGDDAVVDGCLVLGIDQAWKSLVLKSHSE